MNCPKYIKKLLYKRAKAAANFTSYDVDIVEWLEKNNLIDSVEEYDIATGCESICNPYASSERILQVIENA
jgi:hypothetical protein